MCIACCYQMSILTFIQIRWFYIGIYLVVVQLLSCVLTLCHLMDGSMPGFPVFHYLLEFAQIHVH